MEQVNPEQVNAVLPPPVEPPQDVWANAIAGALDDLRAPEDLADLLPENDLAPDGDQADPVQWDEDGPTVAGETNGGTDPDDQADDAGWSNHDWTGADSPPDHAEADHHNLGSEGTDPGFSP